jgi:hypothetical protein
MLIREAEWLGSRIFEANPQTIFPLLDAGSSTEKFRRLQQPWIDRYIFAPARARGLPVSHLDSKLAAGVDIVADLSDPSTLKRPAPTAYRSLLCSNLLEHVENRELVARALLSLIVPGGYLFLSCPYRFPYHPDPIDNRFRPDPVGLARLFPGTAVRQQAIVIDDPYLAYVLRAPLGFLLELGRLLLPFYEPQAWRRALVTMANSLTWTLRSFAATCVVLQRER